MVDVERICIAAVSGLCTVKERERKKNHGNLAVINHWLTFTKWLKLFITITIIGF